MRKSVNKKCLNCAATFRTYQAYIDKGHGKFCSSRCNGLYYAKSTSERVRTGKEKICLACNKPYYSANWETRKYCSYKCYWNHSRQSSNLERRIIKNISSRIRFALKRGHFTKNQSSVEILGCNIKEYKDYLENMFLTNMSWENYGFTGWHIDHIVPLCTFNLTDSEEQRKAFHYTNTQPLWRVDNLKKRHLKNQSAMRSEETVALLQSTVLQ